MFYEIVVFSRKIFVFLLLNISCSFAYSEEIIIGVNDWCPHVCIPSKENPEHGYTVDIATKILTDAGYKVKISVAPWKRLVSESREGGIDIITSGYKQEAPFLNFSDKYIGVTDEAIYVRDSEDWKYEGVSSLDGIGSIGVIRGATYGDDNIFNSYIISNPSKFIQVSGSEVVSRLLKMLASGRLNAIVGETNAIGYYTMKDGFSWKPKVAGKLMNKGYIFIGVSPNHPQSEELVDVINRGLFRLRKSGHIAKIMSEYGLGGGDG